MAHNDIQRVLADLNDKLQQLLNPSFKKPPPNRILQILNGAWKATKWGSLGIGVIGVVGVSVVGCLSVRDFLRGHDKDTVDTALKRLADYVASADAYEPDVRDAVDGERHDFVSHEVVEDDEDDDGSEDGDAPPGLARPRRGPASRRVARRKVRVHADGSGKARRDSYYGEVVAEARVHHFARGYDAYNAQLARSFMVRTMQAHGIRASHIASRIEDMVTAVFTVGPDEVRVRDEREQLVRSGRLNLPAKR
jgi:hypothetical protein